MRSASLIMKATRLCNLRCAYCHDWRRGPGQTMSFAVLARVIAAALRDESHDAVEFIWHGGEPTLLPTTFFLKALLVQSRFRRSGQRVGNTIQTNATRLTPAWCGFLRENRFSVSISLDGPPAVHDRHRPTVSGRPSWEDTRRGLALLRHHGIPTSVLMVVDADTLALGPQAVFDFFVEQEIDRYGLIAAAPDNRRDATRDVGVAHYTDPAAMTRFLVGMERCRQAHGDHAIRIRELDNLYERLAGAPAGSCTVAGNCFGNYYLVEPSGEIAHCDLFTGDDRYSLGSIDGQYDFSAFRRSERLTRLRHDNERAIDALRACPEFRVCNGWCPHERYLSVRHDPHHDPACCGLRPLIEHLRAQSPLTTPTAIPARSPMG